MPVGGPDGDADGASVCGCDIGKQSVGMDEPVADHLLESLKLKRIAFRAAKLWPSQEDD